MLHRQEPSAQTTHLYISKRHFGINRQVMDEQAGAVVCKEFQQTAGRPLTRWQDTNICVRAVMDAKSQKQTRMEDSCELPMSVRIRKVTLKRRPKDVRYINEKENSNYKKRMS